MATDTNNTTEAWGQVKGFSDYKISSHGRAKRVKQGRYIGKIPIDGLILKLTVDINGYSVIHLVDDAGKSKFMKISRLVLTAFYGPPPTNKHVAAHYDGNKQNNNLSNLRWATDHENKMDMLRHGTDRRGEKHPLAKLTWEMVEKIRVDFFCNSMRRSDISDKYGIKINNVYRVTTGSGWNPPIHLNSKEGGK